MAPKTPQIHALPLLLLVILAGHIVVAEGRHIKSSKPPSFDAVRIAIDLQCGLIASPAQEAGQTDRNRPETLAIVTDIRKTEASKDQAHTVDAHSDAAPVKSYTIGLFTGNNEANKHTPDLPLVNNGRHKSYTNGHIAEKRRFQEIITTDSTQGNGPRPPPRVSTVPGHSPGDGN